MRDSLWMGTMESLNRFPLASPDVEQATSQLLDEDGKQLASIEGVMIEAQFRCSWGYLVITSNASPFEEELHFYLLDGNLSVIDSLSLGQVYHSGILRQLQPGPTDQLEFSFFGEERWRLSVLAEPRRRLPLPFSSVRYSGGALRSHTLYLEKFST